MELFTGGLDIYEYYVVINYINYILVEPFSIYYLILLLELYFKHYFTKQVIHFL